MPKRQDHSVVRSNRSPRAGMGGKLNCRPLAILAVLGFVTPSPAQSIQWDWDGVSSQNWSVTTNWNPQDVPDASNETATIGEAGAYTVQLNMSPTIQHLLITNPTATLDMWSSASLTVTEPNGVTNYGTILGDSASFIIGALINHGTYESPGAINSIDGPVTNEALSPEGIRIRGPSSLELYGPTVTNNGTIHINYNQYTGLSPIYLTFKADTVLDGTGEIIMDKFARLVTDVGAGATLTQGPDHTIRGKGNLGAKLINDGAVRADDPSFWLTLDENPKTNNGTFVAEAGCRMDIFGAFDITQGSSGVILADGGTVFFKSTSTVTPLTVIGGSVSTLNGGAIKTASSDTKLIDVTVSGSLDVDFATALLVAGDGLTNNGTIRVDPTAHASFTHFVFVDDSELGGQGELILGRGFYARLFVADGFVGVNGVEHTIRGNGLIRGNLVNDGTIAPGESIGQIDSLSPTTLTQSSTGVLDVEVAGTGTSQYDRLTGPASFELDGTLRVSIVAPYVPALGHSYTIITGSSVSGAFATIEGDPPGPGLDWEVSYTATTVVLSVVQCALAITEQPQTQIVCRGTQVTLSVSAKGATEYQWRLGGEEIEGATEPTYFILFALPADSGNYDVVVTSQCGSITSANAALSVLAGGSGDANGDGSFDALDLQPMIDALFAGGPIDAGYCAADLNANGIVDFGDVDAFVVTLLSL